MKLTPHAIAVAAVAVLAGGVAQAQDNIFKIGLIRYDTHSETSGLSASAAGNPIQLPPGDATTTDATTLLLTYERMLMPNVGLEFVVGIPPEIKANADGNLAAALRQLGYGTDILSAKNVSPTVLLNYHFGQPGDVWRPYLGAGINYTRFTSIKSSLPTDSISMSSSTGLAIQAGVNYAVDKNWGLFASIARVDTKTDVDAVVSAGVLAPVPVTIKTSVDLKPWTYAFGAYWAF
jgi:outer membrane protein